MNQWFYGVVNCAADRTSKESGTNVASDFMSSLSPVVSCPDFSNTPVNHPFNIGKSSAMLHLMDGYLDKV